MKVIVTAASGCTGPYLIEYHLAQGDNVGGVEVLPFHFYRHAMGGANE